MRLLILLLILISPSSFASDLNILVEPASPTLMSSDFRKPSSGPIVSGPWFKGTYTIENQFSVPITLVGIGWEVTSSENIKTSDFIPLTRCYELSSRGGWAQFEDFYIGGLPESSAYIYQVKLIVYGWTGTCNQPGESIVEEMSFVTQ